MDIPEHLRTKAIGGVSFHFDVLLGRVAAEKKWSETRVWGGGGGGGLIWSGMWLIGVLSLIPGFALARNISHAQVEDKAQLIRRHLTAVNKWVVENLVLSANADNATIVGEARSVNATPLPGPH